MGGSAGQQGERAGGVVFASKVFPWRDIYTQDGESQDAASRVKIRPLNSTF